MRKPVKNHHTVFTGKPARNLPTLGGPYYPSMKEPTLAALPKAHLLSTHEVALTACKNFLRQPAGANQGVLEFQTRRARYIVRPAPFYQARNPSLRPE